ncbi:MAG: poly(A) polymerase [Candidatus Azotimanducaceae bacterium]
MGKKSNSSEHLPRSEISLEALKVVLRLTEQGFTAYLVGGCVRDLLLGLKPKDFDVATNATPEQVHKVFRNSRIIGRRFQIVHVRFGREIIEVSTFRAQHNQQKSSDAGHVLDDNVFGSFESDAFRRDFTVNALYYCATDERVLDPTGQGLADLAGKQLRLIGDPATRFKEDPVRMLRAIRFKSKLKFALAPILEQEIIDLAHLLGEIPPARLFEEVLKLFMAGFAQSTYLGLSQYQISCILFPTMAEEGQAETLIQLALKSTDDRIAIGSPVTPAFIFAALLWAPFQMLKTAFIDKDDYSKSDAAAVAADQVFHQQQAVISIPKRFSIPAREIWLLQDRLEARRGKKPLRLLANKRFRAAYDFLLLRRDSGENVGGLCDWWTEFQTADEDRQQAMTRGSRTPKPKKLPPKADASSRES